MNHLDKSKAALESCDGWPINGTTDMALLAIANALVAIAEGRDNGVERSNDGVTRWERLFGTPERAAQTLREFELDRLNWCDGTDRCEECPYEFDLYENVEDASCYLPDGFSLLEWLRGDA